MLSLSAIQAKYRRSIRNTSNTLLYSTLNSDQKEKIFNKISPNEDELYAVIYFKSSEYFWVISTKRLIIFELGDQVAYPFKEIESIEFPSVEEIKSGKTEIDQLRINLKNGAKLNFFVEHNTWHFVYGLIKLLVEQQKNG